jgi:hypothetical protein
MEMPLVEDRAQTGASPAGIDEVKHEDDHGEKDDEMNQTAGDAGNKDSEDPEDDEDDGDGEEHFSVVAVVARAGRASVEAFQYSLGRRVSSPLMQIPGAGFFAARVLAGAGTHRGWDHMGPMRGMGLISRRRCA